MDGDGRVDAQPERRRADQLQALPGKYVRASLPQSLRRPNCQTAPPFLAPSSPSTPNPQPINANTAFPIPQTSLALQDLLIFYGFLWTLAFVAAVSHAVPRFASLLARRFDIASGAGLPWGGTARPTSAGCTVGEVLVGVFTLGTLVLFVYYWASQHSWCATWHGCGHDTYDLTYQEDTARTLGQVSNLLAGLLVLPVSRRSLWAAALGVSWESALWFHQYLGWAFMACVVAHAGFWYKVYAQQGFLPHDVLAAPMDFPSNGNPDPDANPHGDNFTVPLATVTAAAMLIGIGVLAQPPVRRRAYELFYYAHHISLAVFVMALWHATGSWPFLIGGLVFWLFDGVLRLAAATSTEVRLVSCTSLESAGVTRIELELASWEWVWNPRLLSCCRPSARRPATFFPQLVRAPFRYKAGQYAFLTIPAISAFESHPFTISSAPGDGPVVSFHIKDMGPGTFTGQVRAMARALGKDLRGGCVPLPIMLEGPYGTPPSVEECTLSAGGGGDAVVGSGGQRLGFESSSNESSPREVAGGDTGGGAAPGGGLGSILSGGSASNSGNTLASQVTVDLESHGGSGSSAGSAALEGRPGQLSRSLLGRQGGEGAGNSTSATTPGEPQWVHTPSARHSARLYTSPVLQPWQRPALVLVAGGIGVTPAHSIFRELLHRTASTCGVKLPTPGTSPYAYGGPNQQAGAGTPAAVHLVWLARSPHLFLAFQDTLRALALYRGAVDGTIAAAFAGFRVSLYLTGDASVADQAASEKISLPIRHGRPKLEKLLAGSLPDAAAVAGQGSVRRPLVFACGPAGMVRRAGGAALSLGCDFQKEVFEF